MCGTAALQVQMLGSGGARLSDKRAANSYLVWIEGRPRVLVDVGDGVGLRFAEAGAKMADLDVILLTSLQTDYTAGLPALIHASLAEDRNRPLPIYGPTGNKFMPSTVAFIRALFDSTRGAYRYLGELLNPLAKNTYKLQPQNVGNDRRRIGARRTPATAIHQPFANERLRVSAVYLADETWPALAWRVDSLSKSIVFSVDTNSEDGNLELLSKGADLLMLHRPVLKTMLGGTDRALAHAPSEIAGFAHEAGIKQLVLAVRTSLTPVQESITLDEIKKRYEGTVVFASELGCYTP